MQPTPQAEAVGDRLPTTPELLRIARRLIWWLPPEEALEDRFLFLARVMTLGTWENVESIRRELGEAAFHETLDQPPPGIFDLPSWHYWHRRCGRDPIPPLPKRKLT